MSRRRYLCPECREMSGVVIKYGFPGEEAIEEAEREEIHLGGCMQELGAPNRHCLGCEHEWLSMPLRAKTS